MENNSQTETFMNKEDHQPKEDVKIIREKKSAFCKYYRRGSCTFTAEECKFAHGISDFNLVELKPEDYRSKTFPPKFKKAATGAVNTTNSKNKEDDEDDHEEEPENNDKKKEFDIAPSTTWIPNINYKNLYEYQFVLQAKGEITEIYSQELINEDRDVRSTLRRKLHFDLQTGLLDALFDKFNAKALKKSMIEQYFLHANWMARWKFLLTKNYIYEIKNFSSEIYIAKQLSPNDFDEYMKDCVIQIIHKKELLDQLPISPMLITKSYYKVLMSEDPFMPSHHTYLRLRDFNSMDDYLDHLQHDTDFMKKLIKITGRSDLQEDSKIFGHLSQEIKGLKEEMKTVILELVQSSANGLLSMSECEKAIVKKSLKTAEHFSNNHPQLKRVFWSIFQDEDLVSLNLNSENFVFSPIQFQKADPVPLKENLQKQIYSQCCTLAPVTILKSLNTNTKTNVSQTSSSTLTEDHIDLNKIVLVNNQKSLDLAVEHFANVDEVGVDLEGLLKDNVNIELIQCSSNDKIFIFDIYSTHLSALQGQKDAQQFHFNILQFLKGLLEDSTKCKIFHDCRQDSTALHSYFNICPSNVFDLSAVYMLIEYLNRHQSLHSKDQQQKATQDNSQAQNQDEIKLPGLNDILEKYQATHGINKLKSVMKTRFRTFPREYFLQRPIDQEFLIYSAKDVEDLVEMKQKMQSTVKTLLNNLSVIDEEKVDFLCKKVSKIYAQNGCSYFMSRNQ